MSPVTWGKLALPHRADVLACSLLLSRHMLTMIEAACLEFNDCPFSPLLPCKPANPQAASDCAPPSTYDRSCRDRFPGALRTRCFGLPYFCNEPLRIFVD